MSQHQIWHQKFALRSPRLPTCTHDHEPIPPGKTLPWMGMQVPHRFLKFLEHIHGNNKHTRRSWIWVYLTWDQALEVWNIIANVWLSVCIEHMQEDTYMHAGIVNAINQLMHVCDMTGHGPVTVNISMYNIQYIIVIILMIIIVIIIKIIYANNINYYIMYCTSTLDEHTYIITYHIPTWDLNKTPWNNGLTSLPSPSTQPPKIHPHLRIAVVYQTPRDTMEVGVGSLQSPQDRILHHPPQRR